MVEGKNRFSKTVLLTLACHGMCTCVQRKHSFPSNKWVNIFLKGGGQKSLKVLKENKINLKEVRSRIVVTGAWEGSEEEGQSEVANKCRDAVGQEV